MKGIIKKSTAGKRKLAAVVLATLLLVNIFSAAVENPTIVTLHYDDTVWTYATKADTVGEFLSDENIVVKDNDYINCRATESIKDGMNIIINVAKFVTVHDEYGTYASVTHATNVSDVLKDFNAPLSDADGCYPERDALVYDGMEVYVSRANYVTFTRGGSTLEFYTHSETVADFLKEVGVTVANDERVYPDAHTAIYNGMAVCVKDKVSAMSPLDFGIDLSTAKVITCTATAYTPSADECGKSDGITATGAKCEVGVVAVDPRVIPLGTKLYIETTDGSFIYGYCSAQDTGGAIKGNKVDLAMNTKAECFQFGRRQVKVYILS